MAAMGCCCVFAQNGFTLLPLHIIKKMMDKRIVLTAAIVLGTMTAAQAQRKKDEVLFEKKAIVASIGYGMLNLVKQGVFVQSFNFSKKKVSSLGPIVLGGEYGITNNLGLGIQVGLGRIKGVYTQPGVVGGQDYVETIIYRSLQVLGKLNYHINLLRDVDAYVGAGLGVTVDRFTTKNNLSTGTIFTSGNSVSPLAYTLAVGGRYYFTPQFGAYAEIGYVNGSLLQLGLVARF
jgi:opacity protein-like surface antigen